jgi:hypothetical protein
MRSWSAAADEHRQLRSVLTQWHKPAMRRLVHRWRRLSAEARREKEQRQLEEEYERRLRERLEQERSEAGEALASSLDAAARERLSLSLQAEEAAADAARLAHEHARLVRRLAEQGARHLLQRGLSRALNTWHALAYQRRMMLQSLGFIRNPALGKAFREWRRWSEKAREDADEAARAALAADRLSEQEQQLTAEAARREAEMARQARESEVERLVMRGELEEREIEEMQRRRLALRQQAIDAMRHLFRYGYSKAFQRWQEYREARAKALGRPTPEETVALELLKGEMHEIEAEIARQPPREKRWAPASPSSSVCSGSAPCGCSRDACGCRPSSAGSGVTWSRDSARRRSRSSARPSARSCVRSRSGCARKTRTGSGRSRSRWPSASASSLWNARRRVGRRASVKPSCASGSTSANKRSVRRAALPSGWP